QGQLAWIFNLSSKEKRSMTRTVIVKGGVARYVQTISVGHHLFQADEPFDVGGRDCFEMSGASYAGLANFDLHSTCDPGRRTIVTLSPVAVRRDSRPLLAQVHHFG